MKIKQRDYGVSIQFTEVCSNNIIVCVSLYLLLHAFIDGSFAVALAQPVYTAGESDGEVSVCVTALSSTAMLTGNVAVIVRTESGTATDTRMCLYWPHLQSTARPIPIPRFSMLHVRMQH